MCSSVFITFLLVITAIPSTLALKEEIVGNPFDSNPNYPYFQTFYSFIVSIAIPIIIRESFNKKLLKSTPILFSYILLIIIDQLLTAVFTYWCHDYYKFFFFWAYFICLESLFLIYIIEIKFHEFYLSKYLNHLAMIIDLFVSLIFLVLAISRDYVDRNIGYLVITLLVLLSVIILFLNGLSNYVVTGKSKRLIHFLQKFYNDNDDEEVPRNGEIQQDIESKKELPVSPPSKSKDYKEIYLKINEYVGYLYYSLNFLCAITFAMISGPSLWWSQLYLTIKSVEYSIYQNSGPDSTYSILKRSNEGPDSTYSILKRSNEGEGNCNQASNFTGCKRALLIGINYKNSHYTPLKECINDVNKIKELIKINYGFVESDIEVLTDESGGLLPTKENIISAIKRLVNNPQKNGSYFFYFSGHGEQVVGDEDDNSDETIVAVDEKITDNDLYIYMVKNLPEGARLIAIFDSCHSGTVLDLPYIYDEQRQTFRKIPKIGETNKSCADAIMFSGCKDAQLSAEAREGGVMSHALIQLLKENKNPTYQELFNRIRDHPNVKKYAQKPQLSASYKMNMNIRFTM